MTKPLNIKTLEFEILGPTELKRLTTLMITESSLFSNSLPVSGGANDLRLGPVSRSMRCGTCSQDFINCPGHLGTISLSYPIYHASFIDIVLKILRSVCFFCSVALCSAAEQAQCSNIKDPKTRFQHVVGVSRTKKICPGCGGSQPIYSKSQHIIRSDFSKVKFSDPDEQAYCNKPFTAAEARQILQNIPDQDLQLLGFNPSRTRPEYFILTILPVPPPCIRPSVLACEGSKARGNDDLTAKLSDTVKINNALATALSKEKSTIQHIGVSTAVQQQIADLTNTVSSYMVNDTKIKTYQRTMSA
jgi:DNA-directed RNA polymerase II subunit RPB1